MTTTVPRGTNRPAGAARSRKAAQRTALPPRAGAIDDAREVLAATRGEFAGMTLADLRETARDYELPETGTKATLIARIQARKLIGEKNSAIGPAIEARKPAAKSASPTAVAPQTKSEAKAAAFLATVPGWEHGAETDGERTVATLTRGGETITIEWVGGVCLGEIFYSFAGRTIKLRNASAARQRAAVPADVAEAESAKVAVHKAHNAPRAKGSKRAPKTRMPFDAGEATDAEILAAVAGRKVSWRNSVSGEVESTRVPTKVSMKIDKSGRSINFVDINGFRSVRVSSLVSVR